MAKRLSIITIVFMVASVVCGQTKMPPKFKSSLVTISDDGKLVYTPDEQGNILPDFSRVGYHHGDKPIPQYTVTKSISPIEGDNTAHIQQAIDEISQLPLDENGHRGTLLLKSGVYPVAGTVFVKTSGIVIKGEGSNVSETVLLGTTHKRYPIIHVLGEGLPREESGSRVAISDDFVPVGTFKLKVSSAKAFKVGDHVMVFRPGTQNWIHDIKMDQIVERQGTRQWTAKEYNLAFERQIEKIEGDYIYLDNPIVMQMEKQYGGGEIYRYSYEGRIREVGIEDLCIESEYNAYDDPEHAWTAVLVDKAENCWVSNITARHLANTGVFCERYSKNVTVQNCRCLEAKSIITGGYRYSFYNNGQQNLFLNCIATEGRHDFVTGSRVMGPNVFYNCRASQTYSDAGPHHRWTCGTLYDNIVTDGEINVQDRGKMGSGHGWAGVNQVLWNCFAKTCVVQSPWVSGKNYSIGTKGIKAQGAFKGRPDGVWEGQNETNLEIRSLYQAQLLARKGKDLMLINR